MGLKLYTRTIRNGQTTRSPVNWPQMLSSALQKGKRTLPGSNWNLFQLCYQEIGRMEETCWVMRDFIVSNKIRGDLKVFELYYTDFVGSFYIKNGRPFFRLDCPSPLIKTPLPNTIWLRFLIKQQHGSTLKFFSFTLNVSFSNGKTVLAPLNTSR